MNSKQIIDEFIRSDCRGLVSVLLNGAYAAQLIRKLSILGVDAHTEIDYLSGLLKQEASIFKRSFGEIEENLQSSLWQLLGTAEYMDFAIDYIVRSKNIRISSFVRKNLYIVPRAHVRRLDGSLRSEAELGVLSQKKIYLQALVASAINCFDPEALRHIVGFSKTLQFVTAESISDDLKALILNKHQAKDYAGAFKDFVLTESIDVMPLDDYWKSFDIGDRQATSAQVDAFYNESVVRKAPDVFLETILRMGRINEKTCNHFVLRMISSGFDCYPGFIKGTHNPLAAYDALQKPRDYQAMLSVCINKMGLPGFKALITSVSLPEIAKHPRKKDLLNIVYELTGNPEVVKVMDKKSRAKLLEDSMGL